MEQHKTMVRLGRTAIRRRRRRCNTTFAIAAAILSVVVFNPSFEWSARAQGGPEPQCQPQESTKYDWERMNYYELLGLSEEDTKKKKKRRRKNTSTITHEELGAISNKEIRKAYRKQAQKYHPDKQQASKQKALNNNSTKTATAAPLSMEESNARFAKIAEAYEFLSDEAKRRDYDEFLQYCQTTGLVKDDEHNEGRLSKVLKKKFSGLFDEFKSVDPFRVFDNLFFGGDDDDDAYNNNNYFDPNDPFSHLRYQNTQEKQEEPVRVFNEQKTMYDPMTGENVYRVLQTEEFAPKNTTAATGSTRGGSSSAGKSFYYRIVAQDFKEAYDPYTARQVYVPITDPYLQEEGYRTVSASKQQHYYQAQQETSSNRKSKSNMESILHPWEVLTPTSRLLVSPNQKYVAGLSQDCELLVMMNNQDDDGDKYYGHHQDKTEDDFILWSTQRPYGSNGYAADHCFALLKGPHLVVTVGQHPHAAQNSNSGNNPSNRILWHSDGSTDEDDHQHGYYDFEDEFGYWHKRQRSYVAQLDNDGGLSVYSVWKVPVEEKQQSPFFDYLYGGSRQAIGRKNKYYTKAVNAAQDLWHGRIDAQEEYGHLYSTSTSLMYKRCISTTSRPFGCWRVGRKLSHISLELFYRIHKLMNKMNHLADAWLDLIYEEDDIFYDLKESIWRNTNAFGSKMAGSSARFVRKFLEKVQELSRKQQQQ